MFRKGNDNGTVVAEETTVEREHAWESPPVVRGLTTLLGVEPRASWSGWHGVRPRLDG